MTTRIYVVRYERGPRAGEPIIYIWIDDDGTGWWANPSTMLLRQRYPGNARTYLNGYRRMKWCKVEELTDED